MNRPAASSPEGVQESPSSQYRTRKLASDRQSKTISSAPETGDFISAYADYADIGELPRIFHELTAIFLLSTILNQKNITVNYGGTRLSLDLWILLLSGSGGGRGTALHTLDTIIKTHDIITGFAWGSGIAFKQKLAEHPYGADLWGEFSEKMQAFQVGNMGDVKTWLTDCHDNFRVPKPIEYRHTNRNSDTPTIEFAGAPRTNFLTTSSEAWLLENVTPNDVGGGWLPRFVILRSDSDRKDIPIPLTLDASKKAELSQILSKISRISRESAANIDAIQKKIEDWYSPTKSRFLEYDAHLGEAFFNRHRTNIIKVAVVFEASMSGTLNVTEAAWERAVRLMNSVEASVSHLIKTGVSARGYLLERFEGAILAAGKNGLTQNDFTRKFQSIDSKDRDEGIKTLVGSGRVKLMPAKTAGRTAMVYVHETFITAEKKAL